MSLWDEPIFRAVVDSMGEGVLTLDRDGVVTGAGGSAIEQLLSAKQRVGVPLEGLFPLQVSEAFRAGMVALQRTGTTQTLYFSLGAPGDHKQYVARILSPAVDAPDFFYIALICDATAEALLRDAARVNERVYRLLEEHSTDVITVESIGGSYLYISPSIQRLAGYTTEELSRMKRADVLHPDDLQVMLERTAGGVDIPEGGLEFEARLRHKDGHWIWAATQVQRIDWGGRPALLNTTRDISRRRLAEEQAAAAVEDLERARERAEGANRAKSEFLASVSHDLRTPLHGLLGMAELLEQTHLTPEQQDYLNAVQESGDMLLARLNDLLDLSKIEAEQLDLQEVDFDLVEAVEGLADILGPEANRKGLRLFCYVPPDVPPTVRGDPNRLRQVLINQVGDAIKQTDRGEVDVRVCRQSDGVLRFFVRDTSDPASAERMVRLLGEPDEALRPKERREGAGIGLSIARRLVALMGGELKVRKRREGGKMMYFDLPLPAAERELSESRATLLSGTRILATDENATNRQLIREVLEQCGGEVELTSGGVETIRNLLDDPAYDCVILNASLPDLDGLATAAMIRSNRTVEHMPLVLMISSADPVEVKRARDLQVNAVLTKPVRRDVLVQAVARVTNSEEYLDDVRAREREGVVLVVEDNEVGLQLARRILRKAGYSVISARDGKEALEQMDNHKIDAVLMDIELPDMDGLEATSRIRHSNEWQDIPVIAMTAHAMKGDAERFLGAGVDCCLTKPVNQRELLAVVEQQLARRHPGCENAVVE